MTHPADCGCGANPAGTRYYTSAMRDDGRVVALSGPYGTHGEAVARVDADNAKACASGDPKAHWYAYGTFAAMGDTVVKPVFGGALEIS